MKRRCIALVFMLLAMVTSLLVVTPSVQAANVGSNTYVFVATGDINLYDGVFSALPNVDATGTGAGPYVATVNYGNVKVPNICKITYTITDVTAVSTGGYTGQIKTALSGLVPASCSGFVANGKITISDPNSDGPGGGSPPGGSGGTGGTGGTGAASTTSPTLTCDAGFNPLNWLACGMVKGMVNIADALDNLVNNLLSVGTGNNPNCNGTPVEIFGGTSANCNGSTATAAAYKTAWSSFRDIALGLLVVASLIVIISSALGMQMLDAYTIRKVLPRIIIVAIAITLSWNLMEFFVQLTNDLGYGIRYLIYQPFETLKLGLSIGGGQDVAVTLIGGAAITALGIFGLLLFAITAALSLFTAFIVMILRQILVTILIIIAPVAIVCYILPNTQKIYTMWWNTFAKALLMFVIIEAIIAAGRVFAAVADQNANPINQLIAFAAYFGVYLIIPKTWQFGGMAVAGAGNMINRAAQGSQRGLSKKRGEVMSTNIKKARAGQRWNEDFGAWTNPLTGKEHKGVGHYANRLAVNAFDQDELSRYRVGKYSPLFKRYYNKTKEQIADTGMKATIEGWQDVEKNGGQHYEAYRAMTPGGMGDFTGNVEGTNTSISQALANAGYKNEDGSWKKLKTLKDFETVGKIMQSSTNDKERLGGSDLERNAGYWATIKSHPGMEYADTQAIGVLGLAAAGRADPENLARDINSIAQGTGGIDLAQRTLNQAQKIGAGKRPDIRQGHGIIAREVHDAKGRPQTVYESAYTTDQYKPGTNELVKRGNYDSDTAWNSALSIKNGEWMGAKAETIDKMTPTLENILSYDRNKDRVKRSEADYVKREQQSNQFKQMVAYQAGQYGGSEADAKRRWMKLATDHNIPVYGGQELPPDAIPNAMGAAAGQAGAPPDAGGAPPPPSP